MWIVLRPIFLAASRCDEICNIWLSSSVHKKPTEEPLPNKGQEIKVNLGGDSLRYEARKYDKCGKTVFAHYNIAHFKPMVFDRDNARVPGCENAHTDHQRRTMVDIDPVELGGFEHTLD